MPKSIRARLTYEEGTTMAHMIARHDVEQAVSYATECDGRGYSVEYMRGLTDALLTIVS